MIKFGPVALAFALAVSSAAGATTITLDTTTLPGLQGWNYIAAGDGASVPESGAYSIMGGELHQNTLGIGMTTGGANYYTHSVTLGATEAWSLTMVARLNAFESVIDPKYPFGLFMGSDDAIAVGFGSDNLQYLGDAGLAGAPLPDGFNSGNYNTYRLTVSGGNLHSFSINGTSVFSNKAFLGGNPVFIGFGDGTGFANANADIRSLQFVSAGVPEPATWALMIGGFGMAGAVLRRRRNQASLAN